MSFTIFSFISGVADKISLWQDVASGTILSGAFGACTCDNLHFFEGGPDFCFFVELICLFSL